MMEIFLAIILGIVFGTISGITPGLHVNTVGIIVFSIADYLLKITNSLTISTFLVTIAICHSMIEFIPSLLFGIPSEDTILSIQPGHRLLFKGKAKKVIRLISFGGYCSIILLTLLLPLLTFLLPIIYNSLKNYIGYLLIIVMVLIIYYYNKNKIKRILSLLMFLTSGILGLVVLNTSLGNNIGLLCILSGLFSVSSLIYSINNESSIPPQDNNSSILIDNKFIKSVFAGSISGCILGLLPGLGPAQGTIIAQTLTLNKNITPEEFLITNSGVNVSDTLFSIIAIYLISNPRSAISVYVNNLIQNITINHVIFFIIISIISVSLSCIIAIILGDYLIENIQKINYKKLNLFLIILITAIIIFYTIFSNGCLWYALICYVTSIALGILINYLDLSKSNLMGVLIIPSIITYLGLI